MTCLIEFPPSTRRMGQMNTETARTFRWLMVLTFLAGMTIFGVWKVEQAMKSSANSAARTLDQVLAAITGNSTKMIAGRAVIEEKQDIAELALMEMRMSAVRDMENTGALLKYVPLGTKRVIVRGHYKVKAGYRLKPGVSLRMEGDEVIAQFPKAEILSVELIDVEELESKDGWANKVTGDDRAWLLRELKQQMEIDATQSGMLDAVESTLRTRLKDLIGQDQVRIVTEPAP